MANVMDILNGISTVMSQKAFDGALDDKGQPIKLGLNREEGDPIIDSRVMDGFTISFRGPVLRLKYSSEVRLKQVHDTNKFEGEIESTIQDIADFIKSEYKKATGNALSLTPEGDAEMLVQNLSRLRTWVQAHRDYKIGGLTGVEGIEQPSREGPEEAFKKFLAIDTDKKAVGSGLYGNTTYPGSDKPKNVTGKRDQ
jgi:hypothetical protein|tara:strand:- start:1846 stop:2436 length:591 start_codon:yes stop_codon:yes gene_type:complete